jgi:hypothetical protein
VLLVFETFIDPSLLRAWEDQPRLSRIFALLGNNDRIHVSFRAARARTTSGLAHLCRICGRPAIPIRLASLTAITRNES